MAQRVLRNNRFPATGGKAVHGFDVTIGPPPPEADLAASWRALEARAEASFFQSWDWTGCLYAERFPNPVLVRVARAGETEALALFNRSGRVPGARCLRLGETGSAMDGVYIEHNGPLVARDAPEGLALCLAAALRSAALGPVLVLSGIDDAVLAAARGLGILRIEASRQAPRVDLARLRREGREVLDAVSANTRYQLRRAVRRYERAGAIEVRRAATVEEASAFLDALAALHGETWRKRGLPGAFTPEFRRFHEALIPRALPEGRMDLLQITAGPRLIGYLLNFIHCGTAYAYQSGFNYADAGPHEKPGLVCHHAALRHYAARGLDIYDFLAGDDRYKASFADHAAPLHWARLAPAFSPAGEALRLRNAAEAIKQKGRAFFFEKKNQKTFIG